MYGMTNSGKLFADELTEWLLEAGFMDQARYAISIVAKYLDTATVKVITKLYKITLTYDMIFTKTDVSTSDKQVHKLTR